MNSTFGNVPNIISNLIYYLFNGPKMVDCLRESYELNRTYHRHIGERKGIRIILSCIIFCYTGFLTSYLNLFLILDWSNEFMQSIFTAISCHLISITDYFPLHSLFYGEWLIRQSLLDFRDHHLLHITDERRFIQTLALTSERFHWLQSLPLLMFCTNNSIQLTIFICVNFISREHYFNAKGFCLIAYFLFINLYTVYIVNINEQSLTIFDDIMTQLRARKHRIRIRLIQSSTNMIGTYELEQYRNCFRLKLFYLAYLNINVLFIMALTIVGLTVFILQTN